MRREPGADGAGRLRPGLAGPAAQGEVLPRRRSWSRCRTAAATRRRRRCRRGLTAPGGTGALHAAAARRPAARLVRPARPAAGRPGQHRPAGAAELPRGELVARHRVRRRALPGQRLLGGRAERAAAARALPLLARPARAGAAAGRRRLGGGPGGGRRAADTDQFLVLGVQFWQNAFKYNSFSLPRGDDGHRRAAADLADVGARAGAADRAGALVRRAAAGPPARRRTRARRASSRSSRCAGTGIPDDGDPVAGPRVRRSDAGKSRTVLDFEMVRAVHAATVDAAGSAGTRRRWTEPAPPPVPAGGERVPLPAPPPLAVDVRTALRSRRSSFGRFSGAACRPTRPQLAACWPRRRPAPRCPTDLTGPGRPLVSLHVFVNHVEGDRPGQLPVRPGRPASCGW